MYNLNQFIVDTPSRCKRLSCRDSLFTLYNCQLEHRIADLWSHNNYIVYVLEGRKIWHTVHGSFDLRQGDCVFVRKGACILEQFFDAEFCFYLFFVSDEFICEVLKTKSRPIQKLEKKYNAVIPIENSASVNSFFRSMLPYFESAREPDSSLLELKFKELILMLADNEANKELLCYFCSLLHAPQKLSLQSVMEDNFCFNLKLEDFAKLCSRSLAAFKRDFQEHFNTSPGKWLLEKRLNYARLLLSDKNKTVSEAAFESGFENVSHFSRVFRNRFGIPPSSSAKEKAILS